MGFLAACPYMLKSVLGPLGGISADFLIKYKIMTIRNVRALFYSIGMLSYLGQPKYDVLISCLW